MTKLKPAANPYTVKGYKGVLQKHKRQRGVPETKKIVISLPVNNPPPPIPEDNEDDDDNLSLAPGLSYPYKKLVLPTEFKAFKNGQLPANKLAHVKTGGQMYVHAAVWFNKMYDDALAAGFKFRNVGDYRSFESQLALFNDRYVLQDTGTGVTRLYQGKTWYLKKGKAPSATPDPTGLKGSNHGWGLAMDIAYEVNGKLTSMGGKCLDWLCGNAPKYGFYLQGSDPKSKEFEAWHWQYVLGDASPHPDNSGSGSTLSTSLPIAEMKLDYEGIVMHDDEHNEES
jgi:LAS superfamily LD-carboxypeptidase LdcB